MLAASLLSVLLQAPAQDPAKPDEVPVDVYFKDGLRFRSRDGHFEARIGGRFLGHARTVFDRPDDDSAPLRSVPNTAFVRQARLEMEGTVYKEWGFKVQTDFASGAINQTLGTPPASVSGTLRDAFVEWKRHQEFQLRLGQFFEPISQEDMTSTRFIDFVERSPLNRLMPGREIGLQVAGVLFDDVLSYSVMALNGGALLNDQGRAVVDRDDEKELAALLRVSPFRNSGQDVLKGLRFGLSGSVGSVDSVTAGLFDLVSTELSILWWDSSTGAVPTFDGRRTRIVPQILWAIGPFNLQAEYLIRKDELDSTFAESELETSGFYAQATVILTGEDKKPEARIVPQGDWGAVELAVRYSQVSVDNGVDAGLGAAVGNAEEMSSVTLGVNWWITRYVRISVNAVVENYDEELQFDQRTEDSLFGLLFRGQVDF